MSIFGIIAAFGGGILGSYVGAVPAFIMTGFLTRISTIPPIISMVAAEYYIVHDLLPHTSMYGLDSTDPGYLPIMFIGIYLFILLAGPGKISLDYFITVFLLGRLGKNDEDELEEV